MKHAAESLVCRSSLGTFFVLAYAISWAFMVPWAVNEGSTGLGWLPYTLPDAFGIVMFVLAPLGPALAAILVTATTDGRSGVRRLLGRLTR